MLAPSSRIVEVGSGPLFTQIKRDKGKLKISPCSLNGKKCIFFFSKRSERPIKFCLCTFLQTLSADTRSWFKRKHCKRCYVYLCRIEKCDPIIRFAINRAWMRAAGWHWAVSAYVGLMTGTAESWTLVRSAYSLCFEILHWPLQPTPQDYLDICWVGFKKLINPCWPGVWLPVLKAALVSG